jgi:hypothetical protein
MALELSTTLFILDDPALYDSDFGILKLGLFIAESSGPYLSTEDLFITNSPGVNIAGTVSVPFESPPAAKYLGTRPPFANPIPAPRKRNAS